VRIRFKLWITDESGKVIIGKGGHQLLRKIEEKGSIAEAARELDLSYKFAWEYVRKVNERVGGLEPRKGGKGHGGTKLDERLLQAPRNLREGREGGSGGSGEVREGAQRGFGPG